MVLPGGSVDDIPAFLCGCSTTHYHIDEFTHDGVEDLLRAFSGQPAHRLPVRGRYTPISSREDTSPTATDSRSATPGVSPEQGARASHAEIGRIEPGGVGIIGGVHGTGSGVVIGAVTGTVHIYQPQPRPPVPTPRQLHSAPAGFVGREEALVELDRRVLAGDSGGDTTRTVVISAIGGTGGIAMTSIVTTQTTVTTVATMPTGRRLVIRDSTVLSVAGRPGN